MDVRDAITLAHREEWARVVAVIARRLGDLDIAEEAAGEAFATAVERWPAEGVPPNPGAWLTTAASRKAIDRFRRESKRDGKHKEEDATRADLLRRLGRTQESRAAYDRAIELAGNTAEAAYLTRRRGQL